MLHALKQPLTGLHCSMELALAGQRTPEQYAHTLRDGLELAERMRLLVAAIGELVESEEEHRREPTHPEVVALHALLRDAVAELQPVAEAKPAQIRLQCEEPLGVCASRHELAGTVFRTLESALSLSAAGRELQIRAHVESGQVRLEVLWETPPESRELALFSRPELGLLLAEAAWQRFGGAWSRMGPGGTPGLHSVVAWLPLAAAGKGSTATSTTATNGDLP
jgi:K+-sensing histidine kinase KdpD